MVLDPTARTDVRSFRAADAVRVGPLGARTGQVRRGRLWVPGFVPDLMPPLWLIGGAAPGPVLAVLAGLGGTEWDSIEAARAFTTQVRPDRLRGTLVVLPLLQVAGFRDRRPAVSPLDGQRLDRVFPGAARGGPSLRLANALTEQVLGQADAVLVLRSTSLAQTTRAVAAVAQGTGGDATGASADDLALAGTLGAEWLLVLSDRGGPLTEANRLGRVAAAAEAGALGARSPGAIRMLTGAARAALAHLGMIDPNAARAAAPRPAPLRALSGSAAPAPMDGLWRPAVRLGAALAAGAPLGRLVPLDPDRPEVLVAAPAGGVVVALDRGLSAVAGQTLAVLASAASSPAGQDGAMVP